MYFFASCTDESLICIVIENKTKIKTEQFQDCFKETKKTEHFQDFTFPTTPESDNQSTGIPNSLYREIAMSLVRKSAYTLCSTL